MSCEVFALEASGGAGPLPIFGPGWRRHGPAAAQRPAWSWCPRRRLDSLLSRLRAGRFILHKKKERQRFNQQKLEPRPFSGLMPLSTETASDHAAL